MDNNCKIIHETSLGHIMDIWDSLTDIAKEADRKKVLEKAKKNSNPLGSSSSIARAASNLTLVFPVLCDRGISIEAASMVSKAIEKNIVSMLQRLFASWQIAGSDVKSLSDYLSKFHGNISTRVATLDDVFRLSDGVSRAAKGEKLTFKETAAIKEDMRNINYVLPDPINETSLLNFSFNEGAATGSKVVEDREGFVNGASRNGDIRTISSRNAKDISDISANRSEFFKNQVLNSEYKKANELMPTTMVVNFDVQQEDEDGNPTGTVLHYDSAIAAVKAKLYPVASDDIVNHITSKAVDSNWLTNLFRASTREISFMKDFVLAIDKAKIDAMSLSDRKRTTDKMWKVLERRALTSRLKRAMRKSDSASVAAITTLVISQESVEYMRKYNSVDIEQVSTVLNLFESLNLMAICIVDESLEVAKFIYDEQEPMWETISFTHLEREASDNTYKKVVNLMTKIR